LMEHAECRVKVESAGTRVFMSVGVPLRHSTAPGGQRDILDETLVALEMIPERH